MKRKRRPPPLEPCPHCGELIREDATSCRHCGSDHETGWNAEIDYHSVEIPDHLPDDIDGEPRKPLGSRRGLVAGILALWILLGFSTLMLIALIPFGFDQTSQVFSYATYEFPSEISASGKDFFLQQVISGLIVYGLGLIILFSAILVTANFIPNTFQEGSVDLLLSKPVSRSALFLSKFFGGCCFYFRERFNFVNCEINRIGNFEPYFYA